jgi:hypothetical protein
MKKYKVVDLKRINENEWRRFRYKCLKNKDPKDWVSVDDGNPEFSGLFFIKHKDFLADVDIAEFFINSKNKRFWMTPGDPTHWAKIEDYNYKWPDGTPVYEDEHI